MNSPISQSYQDIPDRAGILPSPVATFPLVSLAQPENIGMIERRNQGSDDPAQTSGFVRQGHLRWLTWKIGGEQ